MPKKSLAKWSGELHTWQINATVNSPDPANRGVLRSILPFGVSVSSLSALSKSPFSPATPFSPPSGPATGSFNGLHTKSKFLAINIAKEIKEADADYVLALKGNHEIAHGEISTYLRDLVVEKEMPREPGAAPAHEDARLLQSHSEVEKDHGRTTTRHYHQSDRIDWFEEKAEWEGLKSVGMVQTITEQNGKTTEEERYYLCSIGLDVKVFAKAVRGHWGVENCCHWVLDVIFKEDESRARSGHAAQNLGTTRGLAMNLVRRESTNRRGIKGRVKRAGWDNKYLEKILTK